MDEKDASRKPSSSLHEVGSIECFCHELQIDPKYVLNLYLTGSRVYGTSTETSDFDYVGVVSEDFFETYHSNMIDQGSFFSSSISSLLFFTTFSSVFLFVLFFSLFLFLGVFFLVLFSLVLSFFFIFPLIIF